MEHQPETKESEHETNDPTKPKRMKFVGNLEWGLWANSAFAILGLFGAGLLITPIFDFMSQSTKIYSIATGICIAFCTAVMFFAHSIVLHREGRSAAQLDAQGDAEKTALKNKLDGLDSRLERTEQTIAAQLPRMLSESDKIEIAECLRRFAGQKFSIIAISNDPEALAYGYGFLDALMRANWDSGNHGVGQQVFSATFENARLAINRQDIRNGQIPIAALVLLKKLSEIRVTDTSVFTDTATGVPEGEIRIYIGPRNVKHIPTTKDYFLLPSTQSQTKP